MSVIMKPTSVIEARLGLNTNGRVHKFFTSECAKAMDKYVPKDKGNLRRYKIQDNFIIYDQPYASYQYKGMREDSTHVVKNYTTPGTGPYWDKRMVSADLPRITKKIQKKFGGK